MYLPAHLLFASILKSPNFQKLGLFGDAKTGLKVFDFFI